MYHIYVDTPQQDGSECIPHLVEHCVLGNVKSARDYFSQRRISGENYTYYTSFALDTDSEEVLNRFLVDITAPISPEIIAYEAGVLKKEVTPQRYFSSLISKV
jgi:hypothetical protein